MNARRNFFGTARGDFFDGFDQIVKGFQFVTLKMQLQNGIGVTERSVGLNVIAGCVELRRIERQYS